ncbi:MAG: LEA type 2 family protein [Treponema sp.]|jgi:LEA14-like dessication related protein|nr:LEA type 2 family protein [Treponema sp.]
MKYYFPVLAVFSGALLVFSPGCSGTPPKAAPKTAPLVTMVFDRMEASGPDNVTLYFFIHALNPAAEGVVVEPEKSRMFVNGTELSSGFSGSTEKTRVDPGMREEIKTACSLDLKNLDPSLPLETTAIDTTTILELAFTFDGGGHGSVVTGADFSFPRIREPEFSIISIAIMQAELINTRFRVKVRIENPNPFPMTFSSFSYELYGHGRFWADGSEADVYTIPENGKAEEDLFLVMNFINMQRNLLDQVIAMRDVRYRFTGKAEIGTGVEYLPSFTTAFDIQGDSKVIR